MTARVRLILPAALGFVFAAALLAAEPSPSPSPGPAPQPSATAPAAAPAVPTVPFELQPYRVRISVAFGQTPLLDAAFRRAVLQEVTECADRYLGRMWQLDIDEGEWLPSATARSIERLSPADFRGAQSPAAHDKFFAISVEGEGAGYLLSGREWDNSVEEMGAVGVRRVVQRREIAEGICGLALELFRPLALMDPPEEGKVSLHVRSVEFSPPDPQQSQLRIGQLWEPLYRFRNRENATERVQQIPWSYLRTVTAPAAGERGPVVATVISGLRTALSSRRRPRVDAFALAVRPQLPKTRLQLLSQDRTHKPMVAMEVDLFADAESAPVKRFSDRLGAINIAADPAHPQIWIRVVSGPNVLARLPYVPGLRPAESINLPDSSLLLDVDSRLSVLQANLMDAVAQRAILLARIRKRAQENDWAQVDTLWETLKKRPTARTFLNELAAIRVPAVDAAKEQKDRTTAARIEQSCKDTAQLIERYLDEEKVTTLNEEIVELKRLWKTQPKMEAAEEGT